MSIARGCAAFVVALAAWWGLPGRVGVTFPWAELGHARDAWLESTAWAGVLLVVLGTSGIRVSRLWVCLGLLLLGGTILAPSKFEVNRATAVTSATVATPLMGAEHTTPARWTRQTLEGSGLTRAKDLVADEWLLMAIAGGLNQEPRHHAVRRALWAMQKAVVIAVSYGRVGLVLLSPWWLWAVWKDRTPPVLRWGSRAIAWAIPTANAIGVATVAAGLLPDDRALWMRAAWATGAQLGILGMVAGATRLAEGRRLPGRAPRPAPP